VKMSRVKIASVQVVKKVNIVLLRPVTDWELWNMNPLYVWKDSLDGGWSYTGEHNTEEPGHSSLPSRCLNGPYCTVA
jgi:hypothetical protein